MILTLASIFFPICRVRHWVAKVENKFARADIPCKIFLCKQLLFLLNAFAYSDSVLLYYVLVHTYAWTHVFLDLEEFFFAFCFLESRLG